jgi:hypothetical protein
MNLRTNEKKKVRTCQYTQRQDDNWFKCWLPFCVPTHDLGLMPRLVSQIGDLMSPPGEIGTKPKVLLPEPVIRTYRVTTPAWYRYASMPGTLNSRFVIPDVGV